MEITVTTIALLAVAGVAAGLIGYLSGLASLVSYPALLAVGLSPLTANITNTVALVGAGAGAALRAGPDALVVGRRRLLQQGAMSVLGGGSGAVLLLVTGEASFEKAVPWLIAFASLLLLVSPGLKQRSGDKERWPVYLVVLYVVCVYGGYFGAGAGICYFAVVAILTSYPWQRAVLMKTLLLSLSNLAAAVLFISFSTVDWLAAAIMFAGNLVGGNLGPILQRYIPARVSRWVIAAGGFFLAWTLLPTGA